MLNPNPQAKVADFGLSQKVEDSAYYTSTNSDTRLPIRWMAPEVFQSQKFGEASDVWAYGITLVELYSRAAYGKLRHHFGRRRNIISSVFFSSIIPRGAF